MRRKFLGILAALAIIFATHHDAMATYFVEVASAPGVNMFQLELWGDGSEPTVPVTDAAGQVQISSFTGNIDASSITVDSVDGLNGFSIVASSGLDFNNTLNAITFGVLDFSGGIPLPANATSAANAWPFLKVTYTSTGTGTFEAVVLDPAGSQGTGVNGPSPAEGSTTPPSERTFSAVPEPSSFILVGLMAGLGYGCVWLRRRGAKSE